MGGSVRIFLRGYFQCSPDSFEPSMCSVVVDSDVLLSKINEGFKVLGAEAQTSNAVELAATDSQQLKQAIALLRRMSDRYLVISVGELFKETLSCIEQQACV